MLVIYIIKKLRNNIMILVLSVKLQNRGLCHILNFQFRKEKECIWIKNISRDTFPSRECISIMELSRRKNDNMANRVINGALGTTLRWPVSSLRAWSSLIISAMVAFNLQRTRGIDANVRMYTYKMRCNGGMRIKMKNRFGANCGTRPRARLGMPGLWFTAHCRINLFHLKSSGQCARLESGMDSLVWENQSAGIYRMTKTQIPMSHRSTVWQMR